MDWTNFLVNQREENPLMEEFICIQECPYYTSQAEVLGCVSIDHFCNLSERETKLRTPCMNSELLKSDLQEKK